MATNFSVTCCIIVLWRAWFVKVYQVVRYDVTALENEDLLVKMLLEVSRERRGGRGRGRGRVGLSEAPIGGICYRAMQY